MALANYTDLTAAVANWLDRTDLTSRIPEFISLAEAKFNRLLRTRQMETISSGLTMTAADDTYDYPTDSLAITKFRLIADQITELDQMSKELLVRKFPDNTKGLPKAYAVDGNQFIVRPQPDSAYSYELSYYEKIPDLQTNSTNWLMTLYPDAYLYGALLEAAPYLKDRDEIAIWDVKFNRVIDEIRSADTKDRWAGGSLQMRTV